jgi:error-prone DNA polymerase
MNEWGVHVIDLMRQELRSLGATPMSKLPQRGYVTTAGQVVSKQKPPTAKDYAFFDIEDGPQRAQVVISPLLGETHRTMLVEVRVLLVSGWLEQRGKAWTIRADTIIDPFAGRLLD